MGWPNVAASAPLDSGNKVATLPSRSVVSGVCAPTSWPHGVTGLNLYDCPIAQFITAHATLTQIYDLLRYLPRDSVIFWSEAERLARACERK